MPVGGAATADRLFSEKSTVDLTPLLLADSDLHRRIYIAARQAGKSLNAWIAENLDKKTTAAAH